MLEDGESVNETFRLFKNDCVVEWRTDFDLRSTSKRGRKHAVPEMSEEARCYLVSSKLHQAMDLTAAM